MYERRLHLLLDEARYQRVAAEARRRGVSVASVIREAIDRGLSASEAGRRAALERILGAPDMPVPTEPAELREELDRIRARRR